MSGSGTKDDPWVLTTPSGGSTYEMYRDEAADPPTDTDTGPGELSPFLEQQPDPRRRPQDRERQATSLSRNFVRLAAGGRWIRTSCTRKW